MLQFELLHFAPFDLSNQTVMAKWSFLFGADMQYLYIIKCQSFYKIGVANDVESRLAQLSTGNPYPLEVEIVYEFDNAEPVERAIHQRYEATRQRGEWFILDYQNTKDIHTICLLLGGRAYEYMGEKATDDVIRVAEEMQENFVFEYDPEIMRTELRMENNQAVTVVIMTRTSPKKAVYCVRKTNSEFEKYLEIYKLEHPDSKVLQKDN